MNGKIDGYTATSAIAQATGLKPAGGGGASRESAPVAAVPRTDSVTLTDDSRTLHTLERTIAQIPEASSERVAAVRAKLENGTYHINPQVIADKLSRMEWELGRP